jgi:subfamily B ATP-binding cassette protein MsbA
MDDHTETTENSPTKLPSVMRRVLWIFLPQLHLLLALLLATGIYTVCMTARLYMMLPTFRIFQEETVVTDQAGKETVEFDSMFFSKNKSLAPILTRFNDLQAEFEKVALGWLDSLPGVDTSEWSQKVQNQRATIFTLILYTLLLGVISALMNFSKHYLGALLVTRSVIALRVKLLRNLMGLELAFYNEEKRGEMITRMGSDVEQTTQCFPIMTKDLLEAPLTVIVAFVGVFAINFWFGVIMFTYLGIITWSLSKQTRKVHKRAKKRQKTLGRVQEAMLQMFSGIRVVKAFGLEREKMNEYEGRARDALRQSMATEITKAFTRVRMEGFVYGAVAAVFFAAMFVVGGDTETSDLPAMLMLLIMLSHTYKPMKTTVRSVTELMDKLAGASRVFEYMDIEPEMVEKSDAIVAENIVGTLRFENVVFSYNSDSNVLEDINLEVSPGQVVALVGPSGAGKSTLVNMVPRFHDPIEGAVTLDGTDLRAFTRESLLSNLAIVTQEPFLFNASLRENIAYGKTNATHKEIVAAAEAANIAEFIGELPDGYETIVGEGGGKLSGGQRQRVTIARALIRAARIRVLDVATTNLDTESERLVQTALERLMEGRTTLVIAHRLSTVRHADKICVMQDGRICEVGNHDELMERDSVYRRLYEMQFASKADSGGNRAPNESP